MIYEGFEVCVVFDFVVSCNRVKWGNLELGFKLVG